eukprot:TRINITY_DN99_c0_g1_i1.p1 TRINITY_DN99_c0_g1~~TRINITY_DN99_c0_g1_i1.p1  ORF type:complete len:292 (-),score=86.84 TRINITY_DN99_c0_g1_i1:96-971(-)
MSSSTKNALLLQVNRSLQAELKKLSRPTISKIEKPVFSRLQGTALDKKTALTVVTESSLPANLVPFFHDDLTRYSVWGNLAKHTETDRNMRRNIKQYTGAVHSNYEMTLATLKQNLTRVARCPVWLRVQRIVFPTAELKEPMSLAAHKNLPYFQDGFQVILASLWTHNPTLLIEYITTSLHRSPSHAQFLRFVSETVAILLSDDAAEAPDFARPALRQIQGFRMDLAGKIEGGERSRSYRYVWKSVPRLTLNCNILYGFGEAHTRYGNIGAHVWMNLGSKQFGTATMSQSQ